MSWLQLNQKELLDYMVDHRQLFASEVRDRTLTRLWFNGFGQITITQSEAGAGKEDEVVFTTNDLEEAVKCFNTLPPRRMWS